MKYPTSELLWAALHIAVSWMDKLRKLCNLYGDAMLVPIQMGTNMVARNRNIFQARLQQKREFIYRETKKKKK